MTAKVGVILTGVVAMGVAGTSLEDSPAATGHLELKGFPNGRAATVAYDSSGWIPAT